VVTVVVVAVIVVVPVVVPIIVIVVRGLTILVAGIAYSPTVRHVAVGIIIVIVVIATAV
jgi:hypothetical protein